MVTAMTTLWLRATKAFATAAREESDLTGPTPESTP